MSGEGWTPCSVVSVIKTDFRNRLQMLLDDALEIMLFAWWEGIFPWYVHKKVFFFNKNPHVASSSVEKIQSEVQHAYHRLSKNV